MREHENFQLCVAKTQKKPFFAVRTIRSVLQFGAYCSRIVAMKKGAYKKCRVLIFEATVLNAQDELFAEK